ncbi:MAG: fructose-bisphosphatase class II family protein [Verrucomicrobia bacterium]|nr:fructose-bisphosphatase class II family protein [Verrucomicrobiota bacterium]
MSAEVAANSTLVEHDPEHSIEFEFVRATENAALNAIHWVGRGDKESADAAACDAILGTFDLVDICGEVVIGEGVKDNAPGIFHGECLGTWKPGSPRFDIALDPVDGTSNVARGMANSISVIGATQTVAGVSSRMLALPAYYSHKLAFGRHVARAIASFSPTNNWLDQPLAETLKFMARFLDKRIPELVVLVLDRPRNETFVKQIREAGATLRMISDGDIAAAVAPALPESGVDLYVGIGGTPEGILAATALRALGGDIQMRMWFRTDAERKELRGNLSDAELLRVYRAEEIVPGESAIFCATGISDSPLLPGVKLLGKTAVTHSLLMRARSRTVRYIRAVHDLEMKTIHLRSGQQDCRL